MDTKTAPLLRDFKDLAESGFFSAKSEGVYLLTGTRQIGKTTLLTQMYNCVREEAVLIRFKAIITKSSLQSFLSDIKVRTAKKFKFLFIDEATYGLRAVDIEELYRISLIEGFTLFITGTDSLQLLDDLILTLGGRVNRIPVVNYGMHTKYLKHVERNKHVTKCNFIDYVDELLITDYNYINIIFSTKFTHDVLLEIKDVSRIFFFEYKFKCYGDVQLVEIFH